METEKINRLTQIASYFDGSFVKAEFEIYRFDFPTTEDATAFCNRLSGQFDSTSDGPCAYVAEL